MKIGIDITPALRDKAGIGYLTYSLIEALGEIDKENQYELLTNSLDQLPEIILPSNFKFTVIKSPKVGTLWMWKGSKYLKENNFNLFISTSNLLWSIIYPNTLQIVNDIAPVKYPQFFTKKGSTFYSIQLRFALFRARYIITISKTVLEELLVLNNKSNKDFMYLGLHKWVYKEENNAYYVQVKAKYNLPDRYFVYISTLEPRKNHINTIRGFALFVKNYPEYKLVIVGKKGWFYKEIFNIVKQLQLDDKIIFTGYVPEEDLPGLIDLSLGGIMLSYYEGFGLPIIEYTARKRNALIADIPVFKEITEDFTNVTFANPYNTGSIKDGFVKLVNQEIVSKDMITSKYSWTASAEKFLEIINKCK